MNIIKEFQVGSKYWFGDIKDFKPHDNDILYIVDEMPVAGRNTYSIWTPEAHIVYESVDYTKDDKLKNLFRTSNAMRICSFLEKEYAEYMNFTVDELPKLLPLAEIIDRKHEYLSIILNFLIKNHSFELTEEQLLEAYKSYKETRNYE